MFRALLVSIVVVVYLSSLVYETWTTRANFSYSHLEMPSLHIWLKHVFRAIGVPSRSKQSRILLVKYKYIFLQGIVLGVVA